MANINLFYSTLVMFWSHLLIITLYNPFNISLIVIYFWGLITSLLNHGLTHYKFKTIDRVSMMLGFIVDVYFITQIYKKTNNNKNVLIIILCLITGIILFSLSKYFKHYKKYDSNIIKYHKIGDSLHSATHLIVTIGHILLIKEYNLLKQIT
jgi:hypothetical protein